MATCFTALTRPVSFMGLPMTYVVMLVVVTGGGFIGTGSFVVLGVGAVGGYGVLRGLAQYDPRLFDVMLTTTTKTPVPPGWFTGQGLTYHD